jgi:hypothetical protein
MERINEYIKAVWTKYGLWPFVLIFVMVLVAAYIFGVNIGGYFNGLLGV